MKKKNVFKKKILIFVVSLLYDLDRNFEFPQMFCCYQLNCCENEVFDEKFIKAVFLPHLPASFILF